ncbi:hypothetical protein [Catenibacterium mitsuokai]|uniref:hypothetical protein n=1 Tax=Catenibacterium mitsuokai TaxID=100886 RepID=UPI003F903C37
MTKIELISDLCDSEVLYAITDGDSNTIFDIEDSEKIQATLQLANELVKGRKSGKEKGWLTLEDVKKY